jgi:lipopolysaccharide export system permease protein
MLFKRSFLQEFVSTTAGAFLILFGIVIAQRVTYYIGVAAAGSLASDAISTLLGLSMLKFLPMLLSLSIFLSVLLILSRWHRDSEMVVWFSSGLSLTNLIRPVLTFTLPIIIIIALLSLVVTPWATLKIADFSSQLKARDEMSAVSPGVFKESPNADRVFFVESLDNLGATAKNIFVQSMQHQRLGVIVAAQGFREVSKNGDSFLVMQHGRRYEGKPDSAEFTTTEFSRYAIRVQSNEVQQQESKPQEQSSVMLLKNRNADNDAELQSRLSTPLSAFILVLLAIPLSFVDPRAGRSAGMLFALLIYFIYNNSLHIAQAWVTQGKITSLIGLWPVHLIFMLLTVYLFYRRLFLLPILPSLRPRKRSRP